MSQSFKDNSETEQQIDGCAAPSLSLLSQSLDDFFNGAYEAFPLGDVLYDTSASPLAGQISKDVFRQAFFALHQYFVRPGTFEFYLDICRVIWGADVDVEFVVPAPGQLEINIAAEGFVLADFLARIIVDNVYEYDPVITEDGGTLAFQVLQGPKTQSETDAIFFELAPDGLLVTATITIS